MNTGTVDLRNNNVGDYKLKIFDFVLLIAFSGFIIAWATKYPFSKYMFPDEHARLLVPYFIYNHGHLPIGFEKSVTIPLWGFSYANYPQLLGSIASAFFMKICSFFTTNFDKLVFAARLTSILSAIGTGYFCIKIGKRMFKSSAKYILFFLVCLLPQFLFISAYVNNDIIAIFSSSIILYAWVWAFQDSWNTKNIILLSVGLIICALSYYNAFGWILCSIIMFFAIYTSRNGKIPSSEFLRKFSEVIILVGVPVGFFFIRNGINNKGDMFGFKTVSELRQLNGINWLKPSNDVTPHLLHLSVWDMLLKADSHFGGIYSWPAMTYRSFIGVFGMMSVKLPQYYYNYYSLVFLVGGGLSVFGILKNINFLRKHILNAIFIFCLILTIVIPVVLAIEYSYFTDYQPQGRYVMPMLLSIMLVVGFGYNYLIGIYDKNSGGGGTLNALVTLIETIQVVVAVLIFEFVF